MNEIAIKEESLSLQTGCFFPSQNEISFMQMIAKSAAASGLYGGIGNEHKIFMVLLSGWELKVPLMQALNGGIWNIQGKVEISARLMNALIRRAGHSIIIKQLDETKCIIVGTRKDSGDTFSSQFTIEDAKRCGLAGRDNWKKYTEDMLYARAMSRLARRLFPDVIGTAYVEGEIKDAQYEIVEPSEKVEQIVEKKESYEEIESMLNVFCDPHPTEEHILIKEYINKYSAYWKKNICTSIEDNKDVDKFISDYSKWKTKQMKMKMDEKS